MLQDDEKQLNQWANDVTNQLDKAEIDRAEDEQRLAEWFLKVNGLTPYWPLR